MSNVAPEKIARAANAARIWNYFMICALGVGVVYLVMFAIRFPDYRYAAILFTIMALGMIVKRIVALRKPAESRPPGA